MYLYGTRTEQKNKNSDILEGVREISRSEYPEISINAATYHRVKFLLFQQGLRGVSMLIR